MLSSRASEQLLVFGALTRSLQRHNPTLQPPVTHSYTASRQAPLPHAGTHTHTVTLGRRQAPLPHTVSARPPPTNPTVTPGSRQGPLPHTSTLHPQHTVTPGSRQAPLPPGAPTVPTLRCQPCGPDPILQACAQNALPPQPLPVHHVRRSQLFRGQTLPWADRW